MSQLTHLNSRGEAHMVDVSAKAVTTRVACAEALVYMSAEAFDALCGGTLRKGDALAVARVAGISAAKRTDELIPLCHTLPITGVTVEFDLSETDHTVRITATVTTVAQTGVEMEALTAVSVAALTIYDMCKAVDKAMRIEGIRVLYKRK